MSEQRHQRLEADARVDERGRVGVPQLVGHDRAEPGLGGGALELAAECVVGDPLAVVGEQELDPSAVSRVGEWQAG